MAVDADRRDLVVVDRQVLVRLDNRRTVGIAADDDRFRFQIGAQERQRARHLLVLHRIEVVVHGACDSAVTRAVSDE